MFTGFGYQLNEKTSVIIRRNYLFPSSTTFRFLEGDFTYWERVNTNLSVTPVADPEEIEELNSQLQALRAEAAQKRAATAAKRRATLAAKKANQTHSV